MGKKVLSLVLALTLLLSLCAPGALAVEPTDTQLKVVIDLSAYIGSVNGKFKYGGGFKTNELTIDANESNEIILDEKIKNGVITASNEIAKCTIELENTACDWEISGIPKACIEYDTKQKTYKVYTTEEKKKLVLTCESGKLSFSKAQISTLLKETAWGPACTLSIKPVFTVESTCTANVVSSEPAKGSAKATGTNNANQYILTAAGAEGYAFDYWKVEGSDTPIYENPYTVNLEADTTFTAYFRALRVPKVDAGEGGTAAFTYENSSGGADQYTLTATPDELYVFDYWSWEGVPTGAENSAPEEQALPDEDMPEDGGEAEPAPSEPETTAPPEEAADGTETPPDETGAPTDRKSTR